MQSAVSTYHIAARLCSTTRRTSGRCRASKAAPTRGWNLLRSWLRRGRARFIQMLPFTRSRDNLASWLVALGDPEHYGQLLVSRFRAEAGVRSAPGGGGSIRTRRFRRRLRCGPAGLQVIQGADGDSVEESLIYVRRSPARAGSDPQAQRVIVATIRSQIVMERHSTPRSRAPLRRPGPRLPSAPASLPQQHRPHLRLPHLAPNLSPGFTWRTWRTRSLGRRPPATIRALAARRRATGRMRREIKRLGEITDKMPRRSEDPQSSAPACLAPGPPGFSPGRHQVT